jgi:hypothetical protein
MEVTMVELRLDRLFMELTLLMADRIWDDDAPLTLDLLRAPWQLAQ